MVEEERQDISKSTSPGGHPSGQDQNPSGDSDPARSPLWRRALSYAKILFFTVIIAFLLKTFVIEAFRIPSGSMENTLLVGDFLLVNKLAYGLKTPRYVPLTKLAIPSFSFPRFGSVRRGDVIVFEYPVKHSGVDSDDPVYYIKRCVGVPGDTVFIRSGQVVVDSREVIPPSHAKSSAFAGPAHRENGLSPRESVSSAGGDFGPTIVPKRGDVIVLTPATGPQWADFIARERHQVQIDLSGNTLIDGVVASRYTVEGNYYFVLGDNRGNSLDSRYWGFVPEENIVGEALMVYWSWDPENPAGEMIERAGKIRWSRIGTLIR
jgi:signal peptidase I